MNFFKDLKDEIENGDGEPILDDGLLDAFSDEENFEDFDLSSEDALSLEEELLAKMELEEALLAEEKASPAKSNPTVPVVEKEEVIETLPVAEPVAKVETVEEKPVVVEETAPTSLEDTKDSGKLTVISKGTVINGSIVSDGSLEVHGTVNGDISCLGKLTLSGAVKGESNASEIYVNTDRVEGGIVSKGAVKIGSGTVVVGNISASSCVVAGAVKGDFDVNGLVIVDSTAVIKGNINSKGIQINNGAVIDGYCSLSYATVDIDSYFGKEENHE